MKKKFWKIFFVSVVIFTMIYGVIFSKFLGNKTLAKEEIDIEESDLEPEKVNKENKILFLLVGVDAKDFDAKGIRTDTMMLVDVDFNTGEIDLLSLPRDTRVPVKGRLDKLNHAHAYNGIPLTIETIKDFLGLDLKYYVKVDYRAVENIVDAIGGVEIDIPIRMKYDDTTKGDEFHVDLQPGLQRLDGKKAMEFLRWRKNNDGTGYPEGDVGRVKSQQQFMKELSKEMLKPKNVFQLPKLVETYFNFVDTNIPMNMVLKGMKVANSLNVENINTEILPGEAEYIDRSWYWIYNEDETEDLMHRLFEDYLLD